jgi:Mg-chelatase subunit ChlD
VLAAALIGCVPGLTLTTLQTAANKPSNVAIYFTVNTNDGHPVPGLTAGQFSIYEDGSQVSTFESKQTMLNPKVAAAHYTLLLIDMSGSVVGAGQVDAVVKAASAFTERVEKAEKVAVYAFDGSTDLYPIVPFTTSEAAATGGVQELKTFKPKDPSTNLYGAVVGGIRVLQHALGADQRALRFGTLVVFTDGTDRANRVSLTQVRSALFAPENANLEIIAIGVGAEVDPARLVEIGRNGAIMEKTAQNLAAAFDAAAAKVEAAAGRYYLLSYCTPSRAGRHTVRIIARGATGLSGDLTYVFNADGFGPNCDPSAPTGFDLAHPPEPPPPEAVVAEKKEDDKTAKPPDKRDSDKTDEAKRDAEKKEAEKKDSDKKEPEKKVEKKIEKKPPPPAPKKLPPKPRPPPSTPAAPPPEADPFAP